MQTETLFVENIEVRARKRALNPAKVDELASSIAELGLRTPLTVRILDKAPDENGVLCSGVPILVAGHHRLAAVRQLGWEDVPCFILEEEQELEARLWEIAENLHRADLTALERAEHIDEWRKLTLEKVRQVDAPLPGGPQPTERGHRKTAEALGVSESAVRRAEKIASLPEEVRDLARGEGWSQERLLDEARQRAAAADNAAGQRQQDKDEARRRNGEADRDVALQSAEEFAGWLFEHAAVRECPTIITWLMASKSKDIAAALRRQMM